MYGNHEWFGMGGGFMWLFWILVLVVIVVLVRAGSGKSKDSAPTETPMDILRKRYASGDISEEEFERRRKVLKKHE